LALFEDIDHLEVVFKFAKQTKWEKFLQDMEMVVPCKGLLSGIAPYYPREEWAQIL
jgi:hypothetical protein